MPLTVVRTPEIGPFTLGLTLQFGPLVCFFAFPLVAFRTLAISFHATLQCSNAPTIRHPESTSP